MEGLTPKQQVLILLDRCLATGVKGRVSEIVKRAKDEIDQRSDYSDSFYANAKADVSDPKYPGLVFKVGKRSRRWIYRYTPKGHKSTKQITLGHFPEMTAADARHAWQQQREPQKEPAAVKSNEIAVEQLISNYRIYAQQFRNDWRRELAFLERELGGPYGDMAATSVDTSLVKELLVKIEQQARMKGGHGQSAKEKALATLRHLYDVARGKSEYRDSSLPWISPEIANPTEGLVVSRPASNRPPLFPNDVGRYVKALTNLPIKDEVKALLLFQVSVAAPFSMLCRLQWQHIDWQRRFIRFPTAKGTVVWHPLSQQALQMLEAKRRATANLSIWVFPAYKRHDLPMPLRYPTEVITTFRSPLMLPPHFTATAIVRFALDWHHQQCGVIRQVGLPVIDAQFSLVSHQSIQEGAEQWQQYLSNLRKFG